MEEFERWYRAAFIGDVEEEKTKVEVYIKEVFRNNIVHARLHVLA